IPGVRAAPASRAAPGGPEGRWGPAAPGGSEGRRAPAAPGTPAGRTIREPRADREGPAGRIPEPRADREGPAGRRVLTPRRPAAAPKGHELPNPRAAPTARKARTGRRARGGPAPRVLVVLTPRTVLKARNARRAPPRVREGPAPR